MKLAVVSSVFAVIALSSSFADAFELGTPAQPHPYQSAQNFALEIRVGPYKPRVDSEPGLTGTPFADSFGDKPRIAIGIEFDWQVYRIPYVGTIGPGLAASFVTMGRTSQTVTGRASGDTYSLSVYPFVMNVVLRAVSILREFGVPIVPYGKVGLGYGIWRASNTNGTAEANGVKGRGGSLGTNVALGAAFSLDVFDRGARRNMDNATGINNSYIFAEVYWLTLGGLGQPHPLYVGSNSWTAGLAFEF